MSPRGFHRAAMWDSLPPGVAITDADIARALRQRLRLRAGFKLGIHVRPRPPRHYNWNNTKEKLDKSLNGAIELISKLPEDPVMGGSNKLYRFLPGTGLI